MAAIIDEHHFLFLELYLNLHLRLKHHLMVHYLNAIPQLGPLIQFPRPSTSDDAILLPPLWFCAQN